MAKTIQERNPSSIEFVLTSGVHRRAAMGPVSNYAGVRSLTLHRYAALYLRSWLMVHRRD